MQDLEHNSDELFQKAADKYPLKLNDSDWDKISAQLSGATALPVPLPGKPGKPPYKRSLVFILLLLAVATMSILIIIVGKVNNDKAADSPVDKQQHLSITGIQRPAADKGSAGHNLESKKYIPPASGNSGKEIRMMDTVSDKSLKNIQDTGTIEKNSLNNFPDTSLDIAPVSDITEKKLQKTNGFYWGVIAGPEYNEVKNQGMGKMGFEGGLLGGYRLNNRVSIEMKLLLSKKYYYSEGKYFNMEKMGSSMPANMKMLQLEGSSTLLELPVRIRYDLTDRKHNTLFSTAGISSFLMIKENNKYLVTMNGTEQNMKGSYNAVSGYFASCIDFSVGYEHEINKHRNIRIEPYIQLPLKGMGIGGLPIRSLGVHVGLTLSNH